MEKKKGKRKEVIDIGKHVLRKVREKAASYQVPTHPKAKVDHPCATIHLIKGNYKKKYFLQLLHFQQIFPNKAYVFYLYT